MRRFLNKNITIFPAFSKMPLFNNLEMTENADLSLDIFNTLVNDSLENTVIGAASRD